jgi:hypothetical protein
MAEYSDDESTTIENTLVTIREALSQDQSPQAQELMKMIVESEQIVSGKLDNANSNTSSAVPAGTAAPSMN